MSMTPVENLMLPTETMTLSPTTTDAHIRSATLPRTYSRVMLLGEFTHLFSSLLVLLQHRTL